MENEEKKKYRWVKPLLKLSLGVLILVGIFLSIYFTLKHFGYESISKEELQAIIESYGVYGQLIYILISFLQVTFVPLPGALTILVGNLLFGPWEAFFLSFIGIMLGSLVAFALGRTIGRKFVVWCFGDEETVDHYLEKLKGKEIVLLFFMFLLPMFPDDALCAVAGLTTMNWFTFIIIQLITRPVAIGGTLIFMSGEVIPYEGWGLALIIVGSLLCLVAFFFAYKYSDQINKWLDKTALKITNFFKRDKEKK